jgi:hypothetical protein
MIPSAISILIQNFCKRDEFGRIPAERITPRMETYWFSISPVLNCLKVTLRGHGSAKRPNLLSEVVFTMGLKTPG